MPCLLSSSTIDLALVLAIVPQSFVFIPEPIDLVRVLINLKLLLLLFLVLAHQLIANQSATDQPDWATNQCANRCMAHCAANDSAGTGAQSGA